MQAPHSLHVFEDKVYDLKEWIPIHPGGRLWFNHSAGRDITALIYTMHKRPEVMKKILAKYETTIPVKDVLHPFANAPPFLFPEGFDINQDTLQFEFEKKGTIYEKAFDVLETKEWKAKIKRADMMFDLVGFIVFLLHIFMSFAGMYYHILPAPLMVIFFLGTRTAMAAMGHYHCHRKKDGISDWGETLFDMQYVGASIIAFDGHLGHHVQVNSIADPKRTVFTAVCELPRLWRLPAECIRRFAHLMTGMSIRWLTILTIENEAQPRPI